MRAIVAPGTEEILANLFTGHGDSCNRYDLAIEGKRWSEIVAAVMDSGEGTTIAYLSSKDANTYTNPAPDTVVTAKAVFVIVRQGCECEPTDFQALLEGNAG